VLIYTAMSGRRWGDQAIEAEMLKCETIEGLQRAIDYSYRRLIESARREWELNFAGKDPSDACVRIRVTTIEETQTMAASVTKQTKSPHGANGKFPLPRCAS
jgi:hypothetical protein